MLGEAGCKLNHAGGWFSQTNQLSAVPSIAGNRTTIGKLAAVADDPVALDYAPPPKWQGRRPVWLLVLLLSGGHLLTAFICFMRRRIFTILSALSLLLCVAVVAVWTRSHYVPDTFSRTTASPQADGSLRTRSTWVTFADGECRVITWLADYSPGLIQRYRTPPAAEPLHWRSDPHYRYLWRDYVGTGGVQRKWEGLGFAYLVHPGDSTGSIPGTVPPATALMTGTFAKAPLWPISMATILLPASWAARRCKRFRLMRKGRCPSCGYDLRATPERCPECGAVPPGADR